MNPPNQPHAANGSASGSGLSLDDILFTLFRHKRLIIAFICLGIVGAVAVPILRPPPYMSNAKVMIHYIVEPPRAATPVSEGAQTVRSVDADAHAIIASEVEILTSLDVAAAAADVVGPEKVLAQKGGGNDRMAAAGVIHKGIEVDPPRSAILSISFKHPDRAVVKPVLDALMQSYKDKSAATHGGGGALDDFLIRQKEELERKLKTTDEELRQLKTQGKVLFVEETTHSFQNQLEKFQAELLEAKLELAGRTAVEHSFGSGPRSQESTNSVESWVPAETLRDYTYITTLLDTSKKRERELLLAFTEAYPLVQTVHGQIEKLTKQKAEMESSFPALGSLALGSGRGGTNSVGGDAASELVEITRLNARIAALNTIITNLHEDAARVMELQPRIDEVTRRRDEEERNHHALVVQIEQRQMGASAVSGMSIVQSPTPPGLDTKKMLKQVGIVLAVCIGMGLGLAFLIDLFLDRSIKRRTDVERHLRMPVFLTIPDTGWSDRWSLGWVRRWQGRRTQPAHANNGNGSGLGTAAVAPWDPAHHLQTHAEGLRERLMTYFEANNLNLKKPKLVALTGCGIGSGVSTLASSLAATLSTTGDGNVLLVDMNGDQGMAHSFYKGKPGCGLAQVLEPENRAGALVQDNLYLARLQDNGNTDKLAMAMPKRFNHLVPKLKASDYDYIIFDMPPVAPTSATARLASHMDIVLLVLESDKTGHQSAARATELMRESRANVAAVLNKYREHLPASLAQEG